MTEISPGCANCHPIQNVRCVVLQKALSMQASPSEIKFLSGPHYRVEEFTFTLRVVKEFVKGFRSLHFIGPCVTFFGSARFTQNHPFYEQTRLAAAEVAKLGFTIMTGGGRA